MIGCFVVNAVRLGNTRKYRVIESGFIRERVANCIFGNKRVWTRKNKNSNEICFITYADRAPIRGEFISIRKALGLNKAVK